MDATSLMYELQNMVVMCTFYLTTTSKCFQPHAVNISPTAALIHSLVIRTLHKVPFFNSHVPCASQPSADSNKQAKGKYHPSEVSLERDDEVILQSTQATSDQVGLIP